MKDFYWIFGVEGADRLTPFKTETPKTAEELQKYILALCEYTYENADLFRLLIKTNTDMKIALSVSNIYKRICSKKNSVKALQKVDDDTIKLTAEFLGGGCYFILKSWLFENINKTPREVADLMFGMLNTDIFRIMTEE